MKTDPTSDPTTTASEPVRGRWSAELRLRVAELLDGVKISRITRKEIADRVGVDQSYLSQVMPSVETIKTGTGKMKTPSDELIRRVLQVVDAISSEQQRDLTEESTQLLAELMTELDVQPRTNELVGTDLPRDSMLYVDRYVDREMETMLPRNGKLQVPVARCIVGPPFSGKTSFMNRLSGRFERFGGVVVDIPLTSEAVETHDDLLQILRQACRDVAIEPDESALAGATPVRQLAGILERVAESSGKPILFLFDGLNLLPKTPLVSLLLAFKSLHEGRQRKGRFTAGSVVAALSWSGTKHLSNPLTGIENVHLMSSVAMGALSQMAVPWFTREEVATLFQRLAVFDASMVDSAFSTLGGQPMISHLCAVLIRRTGRMPSVDELLKEKEGNRYREVLRRLLSDENLRWNSTENLWSATTPEGAHGFENQLMTYYLHAWNLAEGTPGFPGQGESTCPLHSAILAPGERSTLK